MNLTKERVMSLGITGFRGLLCKDIVSRLFMSECFELAASRKVH